MWQARGRTWRGAASSSSACAARSPTSGGTGVAGKLQGMQGPGEEEEQALVLARGQQGLLGEGGKGGAGARGGMQQRSWAARSRSRSLCAGTALQQRCGRTPGRGGRRLWRVRAKRGTGVGTCSTSAATAAPLRPSSALGQPTSVTSATRSAPTAAEIRRSQSAVAGRTAPWAYLRTLLLPPSSAWAAPFAVLKRTRSLLDS